MTGCQSSQDIQINSAGTAFSPLTYRAEDENTLLEVKKKSRFNMQQVNLEFTV